MLGAFGREPWRARALIAAVVLLAVVVGYLTWHWAGRLQVQRVAPLGLTSEQATVSLRLNRVMIPPDQVGTPVGGSLIAVVPPLDGHFFWQDAQTIALALARPLTRATPYQVTVSPRLTALDGTTLGEPFVWQFHTAPLMAPRVQQAELRDDGGVSLALSFNDPVGWDELAAHLVLLDARGARVAYNPPSRYDADEPLVRTAPLVGSVLQVELRRGLRGTKGPLGLAEDVRLSLTINRDLRITNCYTSSEASGGEIRLWTNLELNPEAARPFVRVDPPVPLTLHERSGGLAIRGPFQPGRSYALTLAAGLPAKGAALLAPYTKQVYFDDLDPELEFSDAGQYLPASGSRQVELTAVNIPSVLVSIERVYPSNLVHYLREDDSWTPPDGLGHAVLQRTYPTPGPRNEPQRLRLDLGELIGPVPAGAYQVLARSTEDSWVRTRKLVLLSELGMVIKQSPGELVVWVTALSTALPAPGAVVTAYNRASQPLAEGRTDASGVVRLTLPGTSAEATPFAVLAQVGDDFTVLKVGDGEWQTTDLPLAGRPYLRQGYEAFLYPERGVLRPGDELRLKAMVRDPGGAAAGGFPVRFELWRPDGRRHGEYPATLSRWGTATLEQPLPSYVPLGQWRATLHLPGQTAELGRVEFLVEEVLPVRLEVALSGVPDRPLMAGEELTVLVQARQLFGGPAAGRQVTLRADWTSEPFRPAGYSEFQFLDEARAFAPGTEAFAAVTLDAQGEARFAWRVPSKLAAPGRLRLTLSATVKEPGGRAVSARLERPLDPYPQYLGLALGGDQSPTVGRPLSIRLACLTPLGLPVPRARFTAVLRQMHRVLSLAPNGHGGQRYEVKTEYLALRDWQVLVADGAGELSFQPELAGDYELRVTAVDSELASTLRFSVGGPGAANAPAQSPARLTLRLNQERYRLGDTARVQVESPFAGQAWLCIESDRVQRWQVFELAQPSTELTLPVTAEMGPNAYLSLVVVRPTPRSDDLLPRRAWGIVPLRLDHEARRLSVALTVPTQRRSGEALPVSIQVRGAAGAPMPAELSVAVVDDGLLSLTRQPVPDPWTFFHEQRALRVRAGDLYPFLLRELGTSTTPGVAQATGGGAQAGRLLNPVAVRRAEPLALWRGSVPTDAQGRAELSFAVPPFSGRLRVMAVAVGEHGVGAGSSAVSVRDPLVVQASFPRFLAPGDSFEVPVTVTSQPGLGGPAVIELQLTGAATPSGSLRRELTLSAGGESTVVFKLQAPPAPGALSLRASVTLGELTASEQADLSVRPPSSLRYLSGAGVIKAGSTTRLVIPGGWLPGTDHYTLSFSASPMLKYGRGLRYLLRYPYGCLEQTTSGALPLVYLGNLAELIEPELAPKARIAAMVQSGLDRVLSMQLSSGGFALWPNQEFAYPWGSCYATHFLQEAQRAGYAVPAAELSSALGYLDREILARPACDDSTRAYAAYVLALAGKVNEPQLASLLTHRDTLPEWARHLLVGALVAAKRSDAARALHDEEMPPVNTPQRDTGGNLHSPGRAAAMHLLALLDLDPESPLVTAAVRRLEREMRDGQWGSTQENAFALLALGRYAHQQTAGVKPQYRGLVMMDDQALYDFTQDDQVLIRPADAGGKEIRVVVEGKGQLHYYWSAEGVPLATDLPEQDSALKVRRRYLSRQGEELDLKALPHGEVLLVELALNAEFPMENVVVSDLLPAGLEIENPRLDTTEAQSWMAEGGLVPERVEMRDDRLLLFVRLSTGRHLYRYAVRAVTRGEFALPPVSAHAMYDPSLRSVAGAGRLRIP